MSHVPRCPIPHVPCPHPIPYGRETHVGGGGRVHMGMEGEDVVVYEEQPGEVVTAMTHAPFIYNITHCSPPMHGQVISERIYQWMDLHIRMGVDHFSLYDVGGVDPQLRALIACHLPSHCTLPPPPDAPVSASSHPFESGAPSLIQHPCFFPFSADTCLDAPLLLPLSGMPRGLSHIFLSSLALLYFLAHTGLRSHECTR
ncbi:unnamed protein product [Closterium sp. NIES-54]